MPKGVKRQKWAFKRILKDGCRDSLVLWGETLIDGHNRYEICTRHNIPFKTVQKEFASRDDVLLWMIDTQFSRRNLDAPDRILLAQKKATILERLARKKQVEAGAKNIEKYNETSFVHLDKTSKKKEPIQPAKPEPNLEKKESPKPIHVREEVAKIAGVSNGTVARFEQVQKKKPEMIDSIRKGEISINQAYKTVKKEKNLHLSGGAGVKGSQKSDNLLDTKHELAKVAGVSHDTIAKVEKIEAKYRTPFV